MKNRFKLGLTLLTLATLASGLNAAEIGIVNFSTCVAESKLGKQEQASFEALKNQMGSLMQDTEKKLQEVSAKFNDPEYMDGLSPEGEEKLKTEFKALNEELGRYQNQYYQVLNQANMKIVQTVHADINAAAERIAKEKKLSMIVNKDACFFYNPQLEITTLVVAEMDKNFKEPEKVAAPLPTNAAPSEKK